MDLKREKSKLQASYIVQIAKPLASAVSRCYVLQSSGLTDKSVKYLVTSMHFCAELSFFISFDMTLDPAFSILLDSVSRTSETELHSSLRSPWLLLNSYYIYLTGNYTSLMSLITYVRNGLLVKATKQFYLSVSHK